MAALTIAVQTLAGNTQIRRVGLKSQRQLVKLPVKANPYSGLLKPIEAFNNNGVSSRIELVGKRDKGKSDWHEIELTVRDYEIDQYGVVNNGVYSNYCQIAHHALLERIGVKSILSDRDGLISLAEISLKFISPLKSGDKFLLRVKISGMTGVRLTFHDSIIKLPDRQVILEAKATGVLLDKNFRPARIPPDIRSMINQFIAQTEFE